MEYQFPYKVEAFAQMLITRIPDRQQQFDEIIKSKDFTSWTLAAKYALKEIGDEFKYESIFTDSKAGAREFLVDFLWWHRGEDGEWAVLACESEWGNTRNVRGNPQAVAEDFEKLFSLKSIFKLLLFSSYDDSRRQEEIINELNRYLQLYGGHVEGEQYLVIDFSKQPRSWSVVITKSGQDKSLRLTNFRGE